MINRRCAVVVLTVLLATGCAKTVDGAARPASNPTQTHDKQLLLDGETLGNLLAQPFKKHPTWGPHHGGREKLGTNQDNATPAPCIGVAFASAAIAYASVPVLEVETVMWAAPYQPVRVDDVQEGVVSLPTPQDAAAAFAKFTAQWQACDGTTVTSEYVKPHGVRAISDVRVADSVVAASVLGTSGPHAVDYPQPVARALGVRGNHLVEVAVEFIGNGDPANQGNADMKTSGIQIAHAIMDRLAVS